MRFDAYAGNVWGGATASEVAEMVAFGTGGRTARGRPRGRYTDVFEVKDGAESIGWTARDEQLETAYFEFKGATTPKSAGAIRKHWTEAHTVSRLDACEDFDEPGAFSRLVAIVDAARDPRVTSHAWQPRGGDEGATVYWGSKQSRVMVRCYEAGKMKERVHFGRPDWARAEAQIRPGKAAEKKLASSISALDAWGFAEWSRRAAEALSHVEVQRFAPEHVPPQFDTTTLYLARAFRRHFEQMLLDFGDWECLGREVASIWEQDDATASAWERARAARSS